MPVADKLTDWPGLRAASVAVGNVRAVAMRASAHLPPDEQRRFVERVNKRAVREGWIIKAEAVVQEHSQAVQTLSKPVQNGAETVAATLLERKERTRLGLSGYAAKTAEHAHQLAERDPEAALASASDVKAVADIAAKVWPEDQAGRDGAVVVNIALVTNLQSGD